MTRRLPVAGWGVRKAWFRRGGSVDSATRRLVRVLLLVGVLFCLAPPAGAQPSAADRAAAEALFDQAIELIDSGDYATACPKLQESQRLDPGVGTLLYLADCYEQTGRTASAWATFKEAAYAAKNAGQTDREAVANEHADALKGTLSYLIVRAEGPTAGLRIRLDGSDMNSALLASAIPVDPGEHRVEASAAGKERWEKVVQVPEGAGETTLVIPALQDEQPEPSPVVAAAPVPTPSASSAAPSTPSVASTATPVDASPKPSPRKGRRTAGVVIGATGIVALSASLITAAIAKNKDRQADDECLPGDPLHCSERGVELSDQARQEAAISTVAGVAGVVAVTTGVVLVVGASKSKHRQAKRATLTRIEVAPLVGQAGGGALLRGEF